MNGTLQSLFPGLAAGGDAAPAPDRAPGRRLKFEWLMLVSALLCLGGLLAYSLFEQHQRVEATERSRLLAQVKVIGDNLGHQLKGADNALRAIAAETEYWRGRDAERSGPNRLKALSGVVPGVRNLSILDADGRVLSATRDELVGIDFSQRDYFTLPRQHPDCKALYAPPPFNAVPGFVAFDVSRALLDAKGRFIGAVSATLDPEYFDVLLGSVLYSPDMRAALVHGDGKPFLFVPQRSGTEDLDLAKPGSFFTRHRDSGLLVSVQTGTAYASGDQRMVAMQTVKPPEVPMDHPLVVAVSRDERAIYAGWRKEAVEEVTLFAMLALASAFGLFFNQRRQRRLDALALAHSSERREAAERLRLATVAARLGVWEYDLASNRLNWDASMFALYGVDAATTESGYAAWRNSVLPADLPAAEAALQASIRDGGQFRTSFRIRRGDGKVRMIRAVAQTSHDDSGRPAKVLGINEDVTEHWKSDEAIRESEARFRLMADAAPVLIWMSWMEKSRSFFNRPWLSFTGRSADEEEGLGWTSGVHADDREAMLAICADAYAECKEFAVEYRLRRHDGVYRWVLDHGAPRFDAGGAFLGFVGSCVDIDDRRRAEADLRKLSQAVEQSATAVLITDADARIEYVNPACCAMYGYAASDLIGQDPKILQSGSTPPEIYRSLWATIVGGDTWRGEWTNRRRDGRLVREAVTISPVRGEAGRITHFVALKEDITAECEAENLRRELDSRLVKLERMEVLGSLAGGIAHDFNNILVAILGFSGLGKNVLRAAGGPLRVVGYFEEIETAGERAKILVQQLLTFSRGGRMAVEAVEVADVAREVMGLLSVTFPESVTIAAAIDDDLPLLTIDPSHLHQVLVNLAVNARDAIVGPGQVVVSARLIRLEEKQVCASCHCDFSGEFFRIAVSDDGPGIAEPIRARVFEPFFTTKDVGRGTGMGLSVVHGISHLYEGHLQVLSEVGKGTELVIYLPCVSSVAGVRLEAVV